MDRKLLKPCYVTIFFSVEKDKFLNVFKGLFVKLRGRNQVVKFEILNI